MASGGARERRRAVALGGAPPPGAPASRAPCPPRPAPRASRAPRRAPGAPRRAAPHSRRAAPSAPRAPRRARRRPPGAARPAPPARRAARGLQNQRLPGPYCGSFDPDQGRQLSLTAPSNFRLRTQDQIDVASTDAHRRVDLKCSGIDPRCTVCHIGAHIENRK